MSDRLTNLVSKDSITNNLTTTSRVTGTTLDARQGLIIDNRLVDLDNRKAEIVIIMDQFAQFTAFQGKYYQYGDILYKRTGATVNATANGNVYDGSPGWLYVTGARYADGFIQYTDDPHVFNNDSRWVKYRKGVSGQKAIKGQIWYVDGKAYRNINTVVSPGNELLISNDAEFTNDKTRWEPIIFPSSTFTPAAVKSSVTGGTWTSGGELSGSQPTGSVLNMEFRDNNYNYRYSYSSADTDGTQLSWARNIRSSS